MTREPAPRTVLCRLEAIPDGRARAFTLPGEAEDREIFVLRLGGRALAYENRCPHMGTPLEWVPGEFLTAAADLIICATHGALFRLQDGACVAGPCAGERLAPVTVEVTDGVVLLAD